MRDKLTSINDLLPAIRRHLKRDKVRIYTPGAAAEPLALAAVLVADPGLAEGVQFVGVWIPGVNQIDWARFGEGAETTFASPDWSESLRNGRMKIRPLTYSQTYDWLGRTPLDAAIIHTAPPDRDGRCNLSLTADFAEALLARDVPLVGLFNPELPVVDGAPSVSLDRFTWTVEASHLPPTYDPGADDAVTVSVARKVAELIPDGAVVQTGIGKLGAAILSELSGRRGLRIYSGLAADGVLDLIESGALAEDNGAITVGAILGSPRLWSALAREKRLVMAPVSQTHGFAHLSRLEGLAAVNSAIEIDLFGQANAEHAGGRLRSGVGGLSDFLRGAAHAPDGIPILALPAETPAGRHSRIVSQLPQGVVTLSRTEVAYVVTEHGAVDLRDLDLDGRARALISIAAPSRRDGLEADWAKLRSAL
jgi:acyl-CoA hydrolase